MPYNSIEDLPESVRGVLPKQALEIFLASFNSAFKQYNDEDKAFATAWAAVKKAGYEMSGSGMWERMEHMQIVSNTEVLNKSHDAILQTLDRKIGDSCFRKEGFQNAEGWNGVPIVYAKDHPDSMLFAENPELALEKIKGRIVGTVNSAHIATEGHPRLMGNFMIEDDEVNQGIADGKMSHSTGFFARLNEKKEITDVIPNHILVFREDEKNQPKDRGAFILNKQEVAKLGTEEKPDEKIKSEHEGLIEQIKTMFKKELQVIQSGIADLTNKEADMSKDDELKGMLEISKNVALTLERDGLLEQVTDMKSKIEAFEQKEVERVKAERSSQWEVIKNTIPTGLVADADAESKLKAEFEADGQAFSAKLANILNKASETKSKLPTEEGIEFVNVDEEGNSKGAKLGAWDPETKTWTV